MKRKFVTVAVSLLVLVATSTTSTAIAETDILERLPRALPAFAPAHAAIGERHFHVGERAESRQQGEGLP